MNPTAKAAAIAHIAMLRAAGAANITRNAEASAQQLIARLREGTTISQTGADKAPSPNVSDETRRLAERIKTLRARRQGDR